MSIDDNIIRVTSCAIVLLYMSLAAFISLGAAFLANKFIIEWVVNLVINLIS